MPLRPPAVRFARAAIGPSPRPHILERKGFVTSCHRTVHTLGSRRQPSALRTRVARTHPGGRAAMSSEPCPDSLPPAGGPAGDRPATKGDAITNARNERRWNRVGHAMPVTVLDVLKDTARPFAPCVRAPSSACGWWAGPAASLSLCCADCRGTVRHWLRGWLGVIGCIWLMGCFL